MTQRTNIKRTNRTYGGEASPYWDFLERNGLKENTKISDEDVLGPGELSDDEEFQLDVVREGLKLLSPQERQIIELYGYEGLPLEKVAKKLKTSMGTVQKGLQRAKDKLNELYQEKLKSLPQK